MKLGWIKNGVLCCLLWTGAAQAQQPAPGSLEGVLTIEDPTERIAALQKFLKTNIIADQTLAAREAIVASYAQLAETQLAENNIEKAVTEFRKALATLPDKITDQFFEETVIRIPLAVSVRGYREEAISLARQLEKRFPKEPGRLARLGEFYLTIEDSPDAIRSLEVAAKESANDARLHRALGSAYRMGLQLDEAIAEYQLAIGADAQDKRAYYELANLYRAHGAYADAIKLYRKQIEIDPKHASSLKGIALASLAQGDEEQALAALNQARDLRGSADEITQDIYLQTQLAFLYLKQNKLKQARQASDAALLIEPRYAWARLAAAEVELADGKYFEAERHLLAAARYANFPTLMFTLGKLYLLVEDFDGALEQFGKAFKYSAKEKFTTRLGGALDVQSERLKDLLAREHQAAIFLAEAPTTDEQFKIAEALVRFSYWQREVKNLRDAKPPANIKTARKAAPAVSRKDMEELDQAALCRRIRRPFAQPHLSQHRAQVDDAARALGDHVPRHRAGDVEDAADVGVQHRADVLVLEHAQQVVAHDAGVVHQHVDAPAALDDVLDRIADRRGVGDVGAHRLAAAAGGPHGVDHLLRRLRVVAVEEHHVHAVAREQLDGRAADAAAAAADQRDLAGQARVDVHGGGCPQTEPARVSPRWRSRRRRTACGR